MGSSSRELTGRSPPPPRDFSHDDEPRVLLSVGWDPQRASGRSLEPLIGRRRRREPCGLKELGPKAFPGGYAPSAWGAVRSRDKSRLHPLAGGADSADGATEESEFWNARRDWAKALPHSKFRWPTILASDWVDRKRKRRDSASGADPGRALQRVLQLRWRRL